MNFEQYLLDKKINSTAFKTAEPIRWEEWLVEFDQINPKSFTAQKFYLINPIRKKYPIQESQKN